MICTEGVSETMDITITTRSKAVISSVSEFREYLVPRPPQYQSSKAPAAGYGKIH
jgi:hypothetical protein